MATTAQALQVELEGKETDITGDIKENTILLGSAFSNTMSSSARKKYFSRLDNLRGYSFEPGVVWTFGKSSCSALKCMILGTICPHQHHSGGGHDIYCSSMCCL